MLSLKEYAFVLDANGQQLDPTLVQNAWRLIRQKKAKLIQTAVKPLALAMGI